MNDGDAMPMDVARIAPTAFVGEVVMKREMTAFLKAAAERGCRFQVGTDMLFEQIPAYLEFFGFPGTTPEELRSLARLGRLSDSARLLVDTHPRRDHSRLVWKREPSAARSLAGDAFGPGT